MGESLFSLARLKCNLEVLGEVSPEVTQWLLAAGEADEDVLSPCGPSAAGALKTNGSRPAAVTVVVGGGLLYEICDLLDCMDPGHQVFVLEPRASLLARALGLHDLRRALREQTLVLLPPDEEGLEQAVGRHPQLGLAEQVELRHLHQDGNPQAAAAQARLYRVLGQALAARDDALAWEDEKGANLIENLGHVAFMARAAELPGALAGRPAILAAAGASLSRALEHLAGNLGGAAFFCTDRALGSVLEAGIIPTAAGTSRPTPGILSQTRHPNLARVPLVAEEVANAPTLRRHQGPRFVCMGPRGTALGPLGRFSTAFTPQHHALSRLCEVALLAGCRPLILVGMELTSDDGALSAPSSNGRLVRTSLDQAAAARYLGQVLARYEAPALNTTPYGLRLPGTQPCTWQQALEPLGEAGQPLQIPSLASEDWLSPQGMMSYAEGLGLAAANATRLWQRAAAPLADCPQLVMERPHDWLGAADNLFLALAEQAAADSLQAAFLDACLVRAFRCRHKLACQSRGQDVTINDVCQGLSHCLADLEGRAAKLADGLRSAALAFRNLAQARTAGDAAALGQFALQMGHVPPPLH